MFYSMTDVLKQSQSRSQKVYIIPFANMLHNKLKHIFPKITSQDILTEVEGIFIYWETSAIYQNDFIGYLISWLNEYKVCLRSGKQFVMDDMPEQYDDMFLKKSINDIMHNPLMKEIFKLNVMEDNISHFNMTHISGENLEMFLKSNPHMNERIANDVEVSETICRNFRQFIMDDLIRREKLLIALSEELENKRKEYIIKANKKNNY